MPSIGTPRERAFSRVATSTNAVELRQTAKNAGTSGDEALERAALLKLYEVMPSQEPGTLEHDVWRSIFALENVLSVERGKTTRLGRTRQKIARDGEAKTVADLVMGKPTEGFAMLTNRAMVDWTFEAVALRHTEQFGVDVIDRARDRLERI